MIPAILSCVFVAYLYKTLNAEPEVDRLVESENAEDRVRGLQLRIEKLTNQISGNGEAK